MNTVHTDENVIIIIIFLNNLKLTGNFCLVFELIKSLSFLIVCEVIFFFKHYNKRLFLFCTIQRHREEKSTFDD